MRPWMSSLQRITLRQLRRTSESAGSLAARGYLSIANFTQHDKIRVNLRILEVLTVPKPRQRESHFGNAGELDSPRSNQIQGERGGVVFP